MASSMVYPEKNYEDDVESSTKNTRRNKPSWLRQQQFTVPPYYTTLFRLIDGTWLTVNDSEEEGALQQFNNGNINIALICALLFTTYLPLMYDEVNKVSIPDDGLTIDIFGGYINSIGPIILSKAFIHDWFDCFYIFSVAGTLFGTMISVFYTLAANECGTDSKMMVLLHTLGPQISCAPFYYFSIGIVSWACGGYLQLTLVPRTLPGLILKEGIVVILIAVLLGLCIPRMVQGVFAGKVEEMENPPISLTDDQINEKITSFFKQHDTDSRSELTLKSLMKFVTKLTKRGYRIPLDVFTEVKLKKAYYEHIAKTTGVSYEDVKEFLAK